MIERSPEEIRTENVKRMGDGLGSQFSALWQELCNIHVEWQEYVVLFGTSRERIELLNKSAPAFFHMIQERFWDATLLSISRFTDPSVMARRTNLTVTSLPALISDTELKAKVQHLVDVAKEKTSFCREWRNRRIAHNDLQLALDATAAPLPEASRHLVNEALKSLSAILGEIEAYYEKGYSTDYTDIVIMNGAEDLLYILHEGVTAQSERTRRIMEDRYTSDDLKDVSL